MSDLFRPMLDQLKALWDRVDKTPTIRWATVATASPLTVFVDGSIDTSGNPVPAPATTAIKRLAVGERVLCVEQDRRVTVIQRTVADTGWVTLAPAAGVTGTIQYRRSGMVAEVVADVGGIGAGDTLLSSALPPGVAPGPGIHTGPSWCDPNATGIGYVNSAGQVRHGRCAVTPTRAQFSIQYIVGT